ncbi:MAG: YjbH domain-containing protein [Flavobacteriaceae bacterium]
MKNFTWLILLLLGAQGLWSQSLSGTRGLVRIPSADMYPDKTFAIGTSYTPNGYFRRTYGALQGQIVDSPGANTFITLNILPYLEVMFRYTHELNNRVNPNTSYFPDRMFTARLRLVEEKEYWPNITVGVQDLSAAFDLTCKGCSNFSAFYWVATKHFDVKDFRLGLTLGNASDFLDLPARDYRGTFWGGSLSHKSLKNLEFVLDYDTRMFNTAVRGYFWEKLHLMVGLMDLNKLTGTIAYRYTL